MGTTIVCEKSVKSLNINCFFQFSCTLNKNLAVKSGKANDCKMPGEFEKCGPEVVAGSGGYGGYRTRRAMIQGRTPIIEDVCFFAQKI